MSFKYINPGFNVGDLAGMEMETSNNSKYSGGVYLKGNAFFHLPVGTKIVFFSVSFNDQNFDSRICVYDSNSKNKTGYTHNNPPVIHINSSEKFHCPKRNNPNVSDGVKNIYMQIISHNENGEMKFYCQGQLLYEYTGNVMNGADISYLEFYTQHAFNIANIIISDEYFPPSEKIIALPVANTTATMTNNGDGSYTADEVGETVMQTIDAAKLTQAIGEGNTLTGFALIGNSAYYDGVGMTHLAAMKGETIKESVALPMNTDGKILASWSDNVKQADIADLSLGWKAQE